MRCILHIGTEKTGSTAIQNYLFTNRDILLEKGVHVCVSAGHGNNRALPAAFMSLDKQDDYLRANKINSDVARKKWKSRLLDSFAKEVRGAHSASKVFLVSSEHFQSRLTSPEEVERLQEFIAPLFDEIEIICYLRRQDKMAISRYSEALRAGYTPAAPLARGLLRKKFSKLPHYFNFESLLDRWAEAFGEHQIKPRLYSGSDLVGGDIVTDFMGAIGVECGAYERSVKKNIALSAEAQLILYGVNKSLSDSEWKVSSKIRKPLVKYLQEHALGVSRQPTAAEAEKFYQVFETSNNVVAQRWFDREELFNPDFSEYPDRDRPIDTEKAIELLADFMCTVLRK